MWPHAHADCLAITGCLCLSCPYMPLQVYTVPQQWSWPLDLPTAFYGIFSSGDLKVPEMQCETVGPMHVLRNAGFTFAGRRYRSTMVFRN